MIWQVSSGTLLKVVFLDVGQGDAIFIEAPNGNQILIDGGANSQVLRELSKVMPFYDRSIDMIIATHPDKDHIGGLIPVVQNYKIDLFLHSGVESNTQIAEILQNTVENKEIKKILAKRGMTFDLGNEIKLKVLFPDRDVSKVESNTASIVVKLEYGNNSFLLTGDSPKSIEKYLVLLDGSGLKSDVLKAGHHGSKTSNSEIFLNYVLPEIVVISAGEDNRYGHPHQEVLDLLTKIEVLETSKLGSIFFLSDGERVWLK